MLRVDRFICGRVTRPSREVRFAHTLLAVLMTQDDPEKLKRKLFEFARDFPLFKLIGFELVDFGPTWAKTRIALRPELCNPNGVMHGGVIATLIDASITQAMLMTEEYQAVRESKGGSMSSVDLRVKYLRPLVAGYALCEA